MRRKPDPFGLPRLREDPSRRSYRVRDTAGETSKASDLILAVSCTRYVGANNSQDLQESSASVKIRCGNENRSAMAFKDVMEARDHHGRA
jgi:hypothetical protein